MARYVVFRPSPTEGWRVQMEELDSSGVHRPRGEVRDFEFGGTFAEAHQWALAQHPGMDVFVPQTTYVEGMTPEEDAALVAVSGRAREEES